MNEEEHLIDTSSDDAVVVAHSSDFNVQKEGKKKRWWQIGPGTIRGSVFTLCSATLGAGALSVPFAFSKTGILLGAAMLLIGGIATVKSIELLLIARKHSGLASYEDITRALLGNGMGRLMDVSIVLFCFGTSAGYIVAIGDVLEPLLQLKGVPSFLSRKLLMVVFWALVMFPLSLVEKVNSLTWTSMMGVLSILYLVFATAFHSIHTVVDEGWGDVALGPSNIDVITAMPIIIFAYTCQPNVFSIQTELQRSTPERMSRVTRMALGVCFCVYLGMGSFGYLDFLGDTKGNILNNYPIEKGIHSAADVVVVLAFIAISATVAMAFPLNCFPCRFTVEYMIFGTDARPKWARPVLTTIICTLSLVCALFIPALNIVFQLLGGTTCALVCFIAPSMFVIKLGHAHTSIGRAITVWSLMIGGALIGLLSTGLTVYQLIRPEKP